MPPMLNKKLAGLPLWAWLALGAAGVSVGLILRSRADGTEEESEGDPCDPESEFYDPSKCNAVESTALNAGYDTGDPCDPTSVTYDPAACQAAAGIGYESAGGAGGPGGVWVEAPESPQAPLPSELQAAEEGGIEPGGTPLVTITQNIRTGGKPCNKKRKPKAKKGFNIVCESGKWSYEPASHTGKKKGKSKHLTGGGAPKKQHNKTHKHGKRRRHKVKH